MFGIGDWELFLIAAVALLLFGNKLPSVMRSLGSSLSEFQRGMHEARDRIRRGIEEAGREEADKTEAGQPGSEAPFPPVSEAADSPPGDTAVSAPGDTPKPA